MPEYEKKKQGYLRKLKFLLSFYYVEEEYEEILEDCNEWYSEEKTENLTFERAKREVLNIRAENPGKYGRRHVLARNSIVQFLVLSAVRFLAEFLACRNIFLYAEAYSGFAVAANIVYAACCFLIVWCRKEDATVKEKLAKWHIGIVGIAALCFLFAYFAASAGKDVGLPGNVLAACLKWAAFLLYAGMFLYGIFCVLEKKRSVMLLSVHAYGAASLLYFIISQLGHLTKADYFLKMLGSAGTVYLVSLVLFFLLCNLSGKKPGHGCVNRKQKKEGGAGA